MTPKPNIHDIFKRWSELQPESVGVVDPSRNRTLTYRDLEEHAVRGALFLMRRFGIGFGDRVAVLATNSLETLLLFFSLRKLGAILVPLNFRLTSKELEVLLVDCSPRLLIHQKRFRSVLDDIPKTSLPERMFLLDSGDGLDHVYDHYVAEFGELTHTIDLEDPCMIIYTSGTTGSPKGAIYTNQMLHWNALTTGLRLQLTPKDTTVSFAPFFHVGG